VNKRERCLIFAVQEVLISKGKDKNIKFALEQAKKAQGGVEV
jgi:hypothetical protein